MMEEEEQIIESLDISSEWTPGAWIDAYFELFVELCELEEEDYIGTILDWFIFDTNFGQRADYCKVYDINTGNTWTIRTPEVLYDYITRND